MPNIDQKIESLKQSLGAGVKPIIPSIGIPGMNSSSAGSSLTAWTVLEFYPNGAPRPNRTVMGGSGISTENWVLPLPADLSDVHSLQYEPVEFGGFLTQAANTAYKAVSGEADIGKREQAFSQEMLKNMPSAAKEVQSSGLQAAGEELFNFLGANTAVNFIRAKNRNTANPNMENMFKTPNLRTFQFSWSITPLSANDSKAIENFIKAMKIAIYPLNAGYSLGFQRLQFPSEFIVSFHTKGSIGSERIIFKTAACACTDFTVQYTPNGAFHTHTDAYPTSVSINATFQEIYTLDQSDVINL